MYLVQSPGTVRGFFISACRVKSMKNRNHKYIENEEITQEDVDYLHEQMLRTPIDPGDEILHVIPQTVPLSVVYIS